MSTTTTTSSGSSSSSAATDDVKQSSSSSSLIAKQDDTGAETRLASTSEPWFTRSAGPALAYPENATLGALFTQQVQRTPHALALMDPHSDDGKRFTYAEVARHSTRLSQLLRQAGVRTGDTVGIFMERSWTFVICYVAILQAGGAYMPVEIANPPELTRSLVKDAAPRVVLTKKKYFAQLPEAQTTFSLDAGWIDAASACGKALEQQALAIETKKAKTDAAAAAKEEEDEEKGSGDGKTASSSTASSSSSFSLPRTDFPNADTLAYVVASSGSTGKPKLIR
jgi:non-ribosomal peptide synthetase component F